MITGAHNKQIQKIIALNSRRKERDESGLFTAEGLKLFSEAPPRLIERVFVSESFMKENAACLNGLAAEVVEDSLFQRICDTKTPQGILTVLRKPEYSRDALLTSAAPFIVVLESLQDPGNVGTIFRTAEGAGASGIVLSTDCADVFSPKTIRSTMGSIFRVPFIFEDNLLQTADWLSENNISTYAAHLNGSCIYTGPDYTKGTAFFIGNEGRGLSDSLSARCDTLLKIPMEGKLESLNAAAAAAILMYTVHAKRTGKEKSDV